MGKCSEKTFSPSYTGSHEELMVVTRGAFNYGANSVARYRPSAFCAHALLINKPVVLVQINYRLGPLGFAMSSDLSSDDTSEAGQQDTPRYRGNFGLIDQRNALEWVQSHIRDFGGDPERVTTFGVSAGSASIHYHILTGQPLFDRAIMMSGTAGSLGPLPLSLYQQEWDKISAACGLTSESATMRLAALRDLNVDELLKAYTQKAFGPYGDGELLPTSWTYTDKLPISSTSRCNSIILGDTRVEGVIFDGFARRMPQQAFYSLLEQYLPDQQTREEFCRVFKFTKDSSSSLAEANLTEIAYRDALRLFFSVATFQFPTLRVAETFPTSGDDDDDKATNRRRAYMYHFEENSPYPGPTKGLSYHGQDALYLHLNEAGTTDFPDSAVELSKRMLEAWVGFAYGAEPWPAYRSEEQGAQGRFMRWGPDGRNEMMTFEQDEMRPYGCLEWARQHWMDMQRLVRRLLHES